MIRFDPPSEEALEAGDILPPGEYDFEVTWAEEKPSKKGNQMIALRLQVWKDGSDSPTSVFDYLVFSEHHMPMRKIRQFCYSTGLESAWNEGTLSDNICTGRAAKVILKVTEQKDYPPKNEVVKYLPAGVAQASKPGFGGDVDPADAEIPFN